MPTDRPPHPSRPSRTSRGAAALIAGLALSSATLAAPDSGPALPAPAATVVDGSLSVERREAMSLAARRYYAFWNSGEPRWAKLALAAGFVDRTLPAGRPQGPEGPLAASRQFRAAVPDLQTEVEEMMLVGDRVVGRLRFHGHYRGVFAGKPGDGRAIDFIATDIYRIDAAGRIAENWHLEDNLSLLQQLGVVAR